MITAPRSTVYPLAAWLRDQLRERGLRQRQLAQHTDIATGTVLEIAGIAQLADVPDELSAETKNMVRRLYHLPERERSFIVQHVAQLCDLLEDRLGYTSVPFPTAPSLP